MRVGRGQVEPERFLLMSLAQASHILKNTAIYGTTEGYRAHTVQPDTQYLNCHSRKTMTYCTQNKQQF